MNLNVLFELKTRIENTVFAGTNLIKDDFRLKKAYDAFVPFADVNPVFTKIKASMDRVFQADKESVNTAILDVLALIDAVVYTQGENGCEGEEIPLNVINIKNFAKKILKRK